MNNFDFSLYDYSDVPETKEVKKPQVSMKSNPSSFDFSEYDYSDITPSSQEQQQKEPEQTNDFVRHGVRSAARVGETIAGLPGDLISLAQQGIGYGVEKLTGNKLAREAIERGPQSIEGDEFVPEPIPSSQNIKESLAQLSKGYTEPKNELEKFSDEVISDATSLALPIKGKIPFLKSIGLALGANIAKEGTKAFGGSESTQNAVKLGSIFLGGLGLGKKANTYVGDLYKKSNEAIKPGTMIETSGLLADMKKAKETLSKGISTPTKEVVLKSLNDLESKASGGAMHFEDLVQAHHDINEIKSSRKLFEELSRPQQKLLKNRFDTLTKVTANQIEDKGKHIPGFLENWKAANEGFATLAKSKRVSDFLGKFLKLKTAYKSSPALLLMEVLHPGLGIQAAGSALAGAIPAYGVVKGSELLYRFGKSKTLRNHYLDVLKNASKENIPATARSLDRLNKDLGDKKIPLQQIQQ